MNMRIRRIRTLGAMLTIFPHPFVLKSALTGPFIRVPNISRLLFNNTAALSSNRTSRPSGRGTAFFVLTTTARRTSPRLTLTAVADARADAGIGLARFTTQTISSPTLALGNIVEPSESPITNVLQILGCALFTNPDCSWGEVLQ